jgi:tRNA-splicing ligase RtcB
MMDKCIEATTEVLGAFKVDWEYDIHHNYAALENHMGKNVWVHRKGATSAKKDEYGIIPGSQGSMSYIVKGLGNPLSFMSCPHGAGRALGRMEAVRTLDSEKEAKLMEGIIYDIPKDTIVSVDGEQVTRKDLAESVGAYKDISVVMSNAADLVKIEVELHPIGNLKGDDSIFKKRNKRRELK